MPQPLSPSWGVNNQIDKDQHKSTIVYIVVCELPSLPICLDRQRQTLLYQKYRKSQWFRGFFRVFCPENVAVLTSLVNLHFEIMD